MWRQQAFFTTWGKNTVEYYQASEEEIHAADDAQPKCSSCIVTWLERFSYC